MFAPFRCPRLIGLGAALAIGGVAPELGAQTGALPVGAIIGTVIDSLHDRPLAHAEVALEGTTRVARSDDDGNFHFDSVPAGPVRLGVFHPLLDSLGLGLASPRLTVRGGDTLLVTLSTPSDAALITSTCRDIPRPGGVNTPDATGPAGIVGRVLDAETDRPIGNVEVSVSWLEIQVGKQTGYHRSRHTRASTTGPGGDFRLCYLPRDLDGTLRAVRREGGAAATATAVARPVRAEGRLITLVTMHLSPLTPPTIAQLAEAATVPVADTPAASPGGSSPSSPSTPSSVSSAGDAAHPPAPSAPLTRTAPAPHFAVGTAELTGRVVNPRAQPVPGARVFVVGAADSAVTNATGDFTLRRLPAGTRVVVVRAVGFGPVTQPVELSGREPRHVTIPFTSRAIPMLPPVVITALYDSGLKRVGFDQRRALGLGTFWTKDQIDAHKATEFHDLFGTFSGVMIDYSFDGRASLMASRAAGACIGYGQGNNGQTVMTPGSNWGPCLTYVIDGVSYDELDEGDMDTYLRPTEIGAIEIYLPNQVPRTLPGVIKPDCLNIVVWSRAKLGI